MNRLEKFFVNNTLWNFLTKKYIFEPFLNSIKENPKKILEIGCGIGATSKMIKERFPESEIVATDIDEEQIYKAEANGIQFMTADAKNLDFKNNKFDAVFAFFTFHHVKGYKKAIKECRRVLKKTGVLYIIEIGEYSPHRLPLLRGSEIFTKREFEKSLKGWKIESKGNEFLFKIKAR